MNFNSIVALKRALFQTKKAKTSAPEAAPVVATPYLRQRAFEVGITPEQAVAAVHAAAYSADAQRRLFDTMLASDPDLTAAVELRRRALQGMRWYVQAEDGVDVPPLPRGWRRAVHHLALAPLYGYAIAVVEWDKNWAPRTITPWPFAATDVVNGEIHVRLDSGKTVPVNDPTLSDYFVVVTVDQNDPAGAALLRACVQPWLTRIFVVRTWRRFLERRAEPLLVATAPEGFNLDNAEDSLQSLADALTSLRTGGAIAVSAGTNISSIETSQSDAAQAFDKLLFRTAEHIYRVILGDSSVALGGPDGSRAAAQVRFRQMDSVAEADARLIAETIQEQLLDKMAEKHGTEPGTYSLTYSWVEDLSTVEKAQLFAAAAQIGLPFDAAKAALELGLPQPEAEPTEEMRREIFAKRKKRSVRIDKLMDQASNELARAAWHFAEAKLGKIKSDASVAEALSLLALDEEPNKQFLNEIYSGILNAINAAFADTQEVQ